MRHTILLKMWMALSGLFLVLFLVVHLAGNLQLLLPPGTARAWFNEYSAVMAESPVIKVAAIFTYASVLIHAGTSWVLARRNRAERPYAMEDANAASPWYARRMGALGVVLLVFLAHHMWDFWVPYKFGPIAVDEAGRKDLYGVVRASFANPLIVVGYVLSMGALGYHLHHGVAAAFRSLGVYGRRTGRHLARSSAVLAWALAAGFAAMPVVSFLRG